MGDDTSSRVDHPRRRASEVIEDFLAHAHGDVITVGDLARLLGDRAFGMMLLVLALPNIIPLPGLSTAVGLPMILLGAQIAWGAPAPWLPRRLAAIAIGRDTLLTVLRRAHPWMTRVERHIRPRFPWFTEGLGERLAGLMVLILAAVLCLPIVFGNLPPAAAIAAIALGLIEKDGLLLACGLVGGCLALVFVGAIVLGLGEATLYVFAHWFPFLASTSLAPASCSPTC